MAWSSPATYTVAQIVSAADLNLVRDNLNYLKGALGAVSLDGRLGLVVAANNTNGDLSLDGPYGSVNDYHQIGWLGVSALRGIASAGGEMSFDFILQSAGSGSIATGRNVMRMVGGSGNVGIGTTAPQGKLHGVGAVSGFLHWEFNGVDGTARTVIPDGAGDVLGMLAGFYSVFDGTNRTAGPIAGVGVTATLAQNFNLMTSTGTYTMHLNANGSVDVQRTAGSGTAKIALWLLWT